MTNPMNQDLDWRISRESALTLAIEQDDLVSLRKWSVEPGGFGTNELRQKVWPYLLHVTSCISTQKLGINSGNKHDHTFDDDDNKQIQDPEKQDVADSHGNIPASNEPHKEERQVGLDTNRSFVHYPEKLTSSEKKRLQAELNELIMTVLRRHTGLSYFQGYHDIISVLYLSFFPYVPPCRRPRSSSSARGSPSTSRSQSRSQSRNRMRADSQSNNGGGSKPISRNGSFSQIKLDGLMTVNGETRMKPLSPGKEPHLVLEDVDINAKIKPGPDRPVEKSAAAERKIRNQDKPEWKQLVDCCEALSLLRIRDGMGKSLGPVVGYLRLMKRLMKAVDPNVAHLVNRVSPTPYFALSWMLTLFSHDCDTFVPVQRIFDYLLCRNPAIVIYLGVALIVLKKDRLMALEDTLDEDPGVLHTNLSLLPPLIADDPDTSPDDGLGFEPHIAPKRRDSYLDPSEPNPLPPLILSELFRLTDSLWERFPLSHPEIRADEILGHKSVVFTYPDVTHTPGPNVMDAKAAAEWAKNGVDEDQLVVDPAPSDSDVEDEVQQEDERKPDTTKRKRKRQQSLQISRTALTFAVVTVAIGIAIYRGQKLPGQDSLARYVMLRIIRPWQRKLEMQRVWQNIRAAGEHETFGGRIVRTLTDFVGWR